MRSSTQPRKKFSYTVEIENHGVRETYANIKADTFNEAAEIAKKRFRLQYWNRKHLKARMCDKSQNLL